ERLGKTFEEGLLLGVDREEPDPRHVMGPGILSDAGRLEAVGKHLVQGGLAGSGAREMCPARVEAEPNVAVGAVEPVVPVGIDIGGFDAEVVGSSGAGGRPDGRLELLGSVADLGGRLLCRDGALEVVKLLGRLRAPADADSAEGVLKLN